MSKNNMRPAELFADGYQKGREAALKQSERAIAVSNGKIQYARKRIKYLAIWRRYAIDRLAIGPELVNEIDECARRKTTAK